MKTKTVLFMIVLIAFIVSATSAYAQEVKSQAKPVTKTESFKVWGKCDMCKARIENGLKLTGVSKSNWDQKTQLVTVTYDPSKITVDAMQKKLASIGHDTEKYKAPDDVYAKLDACCHYDRK